jgi:hypothetical protein
MKSVQRILLILLLCPGGCSFAEYAVHNIIAFPVDASDNYHRTLKLHRLAQAAAERIQHEEGRVFCTAYRQGFEYGFVDYIENGGTGEPPATPPVHLQRSSLRFPEKQEDIPIWYTGYRHGARVGQETGLREKFLVPIAAPPLPIIPPLYQEKNRPNEFTTPELPSPRPVEPGVNPDPFEKTFEARPMSRPAPMPASPAPFEILVPEQKPGRSIPEVVIPHPPVPAPQPSIPLPLPQPPAGAQKALAPEPFKPQQAAVMPTGQPGVVQQEIPILLPQPPASVSLPVPSAAIPLLQPAGAPVPDPARQRSAPAPQFDAEEGPPVPRSAPPRQYSAIPPAASSSH